MTDILQRNAVRVTGDGATSMMFAHGFGCDQNMWRFVTPAFERDYRVVTFDYVGSGRSDRSAYDPVRYASLDGYARDVADVAGALDLCGAILVGHSVSSIIGVLASRLVPERFSRLIMICPSPRYIDDGEYTGGFQRADIEGLLDLMDKNYIGWASFLAPVTMKNEDRPELTEELRESFCSTDPKIARRFAEATFFSDNRMDLAGVAIPSLILQCADDAIAPEAVGRYVHAHTPDSTLKLLEATGHCPHISHPDETIAAMQEYLRAS